MDAKVIARALARSSNVLFGKWSDEGNIGLVDKARARVDVQAGKAVHLGHADLQDGHIALQPFLLIDDEVRPTTLDRRNRRRAQ